MDALSVITYWTTFPFRAGLLPCLRKALLPLVCAALWAGGTHAQNDPGKAERSFGKIRAVAGSSRVRVRTDRGKPWHMKLFFPKNPSAKALVIALHWAGDGDTYELYHDCLAEPAMRDWGVIIASPENEGQAWHSQNNQEKIGDLVRYAVKFWGVRPDRIAITGYSNGGHGSWYYAEHHPEWFCASIPMATAYLPRKKLEVPVYAMHGEQDELFPLANSAKWARMGRELGSQVRWQALPGLGHYAPCSYMPYLRDSETWLKNTWKP